jgi:hypothetical protein
MRRASSKQLASVDEQQRRITNEDKSGERLKERLKES